MIALKNILPITTVKRDLMKLISNLKLLASPLVITRDGKAEGVLMSAEEYESLMETLDVLSDKDLVRNLKKSRKDFEKGKHHSHAEVFKE